MMGIKKFAAIVAVFVGLSGVVAGTAPGTAHADSGIWITISDYTGANVGIVTPYGGHGTRNTGYVLGLAQTVTLEVPSSGFVLIYGNTCLRVPSSEQPSYNTNQVQSNTGFYLGNGYAYDAALGSDSNNRAGTLMFKYHTSWNTPFAQWYGVFEDYTSPSSSCSGV